MAERNLFCVSARLSVNEILDVNSKLKQLGLKRPRCSACGYKTEVGMLRKPDGVPTEQAMCLPCYLNNYTDATREEIDRIIEIGVSQNWWE
jgi:hypothetical protein